MPTFSPHTVTGESLYEKLKHVRIGGNTCLFTPEKCAELAPLANDILHLKREKNAVILAHSYVSPEILYSVADFVGDSYQLSKDAASTSADTIVFSAVKFMADTAKILSPQKQVLVPSKLNGCTLADAITGAQVAELRKTYPDYTFVCYINTTADVKAQCDVCVTSSNVAKIVAAIPNHNIYFLPDRLMAKNLINELRANGIDKNIPYWDGTCYVHQEYDVELIHYLRSAYKDDLRVVSHPECDETVAQASDFVGSTSQMMRYVTDTNADAYFMLTECGLSSRLQIEHPNKKFVGTCTMCKYMKSNTLADIKRVLTAPDPDDIISIPPDTLSAAKRCIDAMFMYAEKR